MLNSKLIVAIIKADEKPQLGDYVLAYDKSLTVTDVFAFGKYIKYNEPMHPNDFGVQVPTWGTDIRYFDSIIKIPDDLVDDCWEVVNVIHKNDK